MIAIRRILPGEGETLRRLRLAALLDAPSAFSATYADESVRPALGWVLRARAGAIGYERVTLFAFDSGDAVGIAGGFRSSVDSPVVEIVSLWTAPAARRRGVGSDLIRAVRAWAFDGGAEAVGLWVTEGNSAATSFYRRIGFVETGDSEPLRPGSTERVIRMMLSLP